MRSIVPHYEEIVIIIMGQNIDPGAAFTFLLKDTLARKMLADKGKK